MPDAPSTDQWRFTVMPSYWASIIAGSLTLDQLPRPILGGNYAVDIGSGELGNGYGLDASVGKKRWDFQVSFYGSSVADDEMAQLINRPADSVAVGYDFGWNEGSARFQWRVGPYLSPYVRIYAGIRFINWTYDLTDNSGGALGSWEESWVDPMIGANTNFGLGAGFSAHAHVDAAGFSLGGSELSWTISGGLNYHVAGPVTLVGTYAYKQVSFDNGETGDGRLVWKDGVAQGWFFGLNLSFPGRVR